MRGIFPVILTPLPVYFDPSDYFGHKSKLENECQRSLSSSWRRALNRGKVTNLQGPTNKAQGPSRVPRFVYKLIQFAHTQGPSNKDLF